MQDVRHPGQYQVDVPAPDHRAAGGQQHDGRGRQRKPAHDRGRPAHDRRAGALVARATPSGAARRPNTWPRTRVPRDERVRSAATAVWLAVARIAADNPWTYSTTTYNFYCRRNEMSTAVTISETDRPNLSVCVVSTNATRAGNLGQRVPGEPYRPGATGTRARRQQVAANGPAAELTTARGRETERYWRRASG